METTSLRVRFGILASVAVLAVALLCLIFGQDVPHAASELTVTFLDVGQGDSILIETPDGIDVLIDGGRGAGVLRELSRELGWFDRSIDILIATHPDEDHIGGLVDVLKRYEIETIVLTEKAGSAAAADAFASAAAAEGAELVYARSDQHWQLDASTTMRILSPAYDPSGWESNNASIVVQVVYGDSEFMLTGDAPIATEEYLLARYGSTLASDVLKLGHHGSKTSSAVEFLAAVTPTYAVVSAGKDNRYGHPHQEVLAHAREVGAEILSTAELGSITFVSDGKLVWYEK